MAGPLIAPARAAPPYDQDDTGRPDLGEGLEEIAAHAAVALRRRGLSPKQAEQYAMDICLELQRVAGRSWLYIAVGNRARNAARNTEILSDLRTMSRGQVARKHALTPERIRQIERDAKKDPHNGR
ncbi:MAG: hypothetical protein JNM98_06255 [Rhodocyclaceae bacterium]|nr:hypothetical protein [Rhodocyclaceae bacterium]